MTRFKNYSPDQLMMMSLNLSDTYPEGTFERFLVEMLQEIDTNGFYDYEDKGGESPFNPKSMLGIIFYGIIRGEFSLRKMSENCHTHTGYMLVSGYATPNYSTIGRFINNHHDEIRDVFCQLVYLASEKGFIDYTTVGIDGTKIFANASKEYSGSIEDFKKREKRLKKKITRFLEKSAKSIDEDETKRYNKKIMKYKKERQKISDFLERAKKQYKSAEKKEIKQNITDPDCRVMKTGGSVKEAYNAQSVVDSKSEIIINTEVSNEHNDKSMFVPMYEKTQEVMKNRPNTNLENKTKFLADNGYHTEETVIYISDNKIDAYIPEGSTKNFYDDKEKKRKRLGIKDCKIEKEGSQVILECPGGTRVDHYYMAKNKGKDCFRFTIRDCDHCQACTHYKICVGNLKNKVKEFELKKRTFDNLEKLKKFSDKLKTKKAKKIYRKRIRLAESPFAHIKEIFKFKKFYRRGLEKSNTVWNLVCAAYNLRKMYAMAI